MAIYQHNTPKDYTNKLYYYNQDSIENDKLDHSHEVAAIQRMFQVRRSNCLDYGSIRDYNHWLAGFGMTHGQWDKFRAK